MKNLVLEMENKGYTITYCDWDTGKYRVAERFKTEKEKYDFLKEINSKNSGWLDEELSTICIHYDYNFMLPY